MHELRRRKPLQQPAVLPGRVTVTPPAAPLLGRRTTVLHVALVRSCGTVSFLPAVASDTNDEGV